MIIYWLLTYFSTVLDILTTVALHSNVAEGQI